MALNSSSPDMKQGCNVIASKNPRGIREQPEYSVQLNTWGGFLFGTRSIQIKTWARLKSHFYRGCQDSSNNRGIWFTACLEGGICFSTRMFEFVVKQHFRGRDAQYCSLGHTGQSGARSH